MKWCTVGRVRRMDLKWDLNIVVDLLFHLIMHHHLPEMYSLSSRELLVEMKTIFVPVWSHRRQHSLIKATYLRLGRLLGHHPLVSH